VAEREAEGEVGQMGPGDFFGERALLSEDLRAASCRAKGPAVVLSLDREHFEMVLSNINFFF
jgi:CRP-like cAMP-binding protein